MPEIEAVISDFGGVLTTPLLASFMAVQDEIGIAPEDLGKAMRAVTAEDGRPLRGAGTLISSARVMRGGLDAEIAFFRWSVEGREGLGTYEVARPVG
jgi:hypothetical protein